MERTDICGRNPGTMKQLGATIFLWNGTPEDLGTQLLAVGFSPRPSGHPYEQGGWSTTVDGQKCTVTLYRTGTVRIQGTEASRTFARQVLMGISEQQ